MSQTPFSDQNTVQDAKGAAAQDGATADAGEVDRLKRERDELFDRLARTTADFQNSRRRLEQESDQRMQYANGSLIKALLPVLDNFERALSVDPAKTDVGSILKGMELVHRQWQDILRAQQVEIVSPEPGTPFDPTRHEALMQQDSDKYTEPTVTQLLAKGYALHGRTLRPAQVAVSKSKG